MKRIVLSAFAALWLGSAAAADDPASLQQLRSQAESGDAEAMLELGVLYEFGFRLQDHNAPALAWYRLAAEAGNAKALARHDALKAKTVPKEIEEANKLYADYTLTIKKPTANTPVIPVSAPNTPSAPPKPLEAISPSGPANHPENK